MDKISESDTSDYFLAAPPPSPPHSDSSPPQNMHKAPLVESQDSEMADNISSASSNTLLGSHSRSAVIKSKDDDEADGENEVTQSLNPAESKRLQRMQSKRESARRLRRRKRAEWTELNTEVSYLRAQNSSLMKNLEDLSRINNDTAVDNRVLKANVKTLETEMKLVKLEVEKLNGTNPRMPGLSNDPLSNPEPLANNRLADYQSGQTNMPQNSAAMAGQVSGHKNQGSAPLQRVASLEHVQKRI